MRAVAEGVGEIMEVLFAAVGEMAALRRLPFDVGEDVQFVGADLPDDDAHRPRALDAPLRALLIRLEQCVGRVVGREVLDVHPAVDDAVVAAGEGLMLPAEPFEGAQVLVVRLLGRRAVRSAQPVDEVRPAGDADRMAALRVGADRVAHRGHHRRVVGVADRAEPDRSGHAEAARRVGNHRACDDMAVGVPEADLRADGAVLRRERRHLRGLLEVAERIAAGQCVHLLRRQLRRRPSSFVRLRRLPCRHRRSVSPVLIRVPICCHDCLSAALAACLPRAAAHPRMRCASRSSLYTAGRSTRMNSPGSSST